MSRRRIRLAVLAAAVLVGAVPASAVARDQPTTKPPALGVAVDSCETGLLVEDRVAVFTAAMPAVPTAVTMAMQFDLQERDGLLGQYLTLSVPSFSRWERSEPNVAGFVYSKRVEGLSAPSAYRVKVRFKWLDADGGTVKTARRTSALCRQPDLRPDLRVTRLRVGTAPDGAGLYSVTVRNVGDTDVTTPFSVTLGGGPARQEQQVGSLAADGSATVVFRARRCSAGTPVIAHVDAGRSVDEADERDNSARTSCPA